MCPGWWFNNIWTTLPSKPLQTHTLRASLLLCSLQTFPVLDFFPWLTKRVHLVEWAICKAVWWHRNCHKTHKCLFQGTDNLNLWILPRSAISGVNSTPWWRCSEVCWWCSDCCIWKLPERRITLHKCVKSNTMRPWYCCNYLFLLTHSDIQDQLKSYKAGTINLTLHIAVGAGTLFTFHLGGINGHYEFFPGGNVFGQISQALDKSKSGEYNFISSVIWHFRRSLFIVTSMAPRKRLLPSNWAKRRLARNCREAWTPNTKEAVREIRDSFIPSSANGTNHSKLHQRRHEGSHRCGPKQMAGRDEKDNCGIHKPPS